MKPIEELAKECGAEIGTWDKSGNGAMQASLTIAQLVEFRTAIIKDFVESLNYAGEVVIEKDFRLVSDKEMGGATNTHSYIEVASMRVRLNKSLDEGIKLYDLSEWESK